MQDILPDSRAVRHGTTAAVLLVAVIAGIVSFVHIEHLAVTHGQIMLAALLLPVSIDGTVAAASLVMLRAARAGLPTPCLARVMLGLSVIATLAANIAYGAHYGLTGAMLSGWPAVAFIGSAEMAIGHVRRARQVVEPDGLVAVADVPTSPVPEAGQAVAEIVPGDAPTTSRSRQPNTVVRRDRKRASKSVAERAHDKYADVILSGAGLPSLRQVMTELKVGQPKAREARAHLATLAPMNGHAPAA